jgi:uncharacterized membrane protein YbhN (UPF0104 family)
VETVSATVVETTSGVGSASVDSRPVARRPLWRHPMARVVGSIAMLLLLALVLPLGELVATLRSVSWWVWPTALATYLGLHLLGVAKWQTLINAAGAGLPFAQSARAYYAGLFGNTFLPSVVGGDVVRAGMAFRTARSKSALILGSLVDRLQDIVGMAAIAGVGALLSPQALDAQSRRIFVGLGIVLVAGALLAIATLAVAPVRRLPRRVLRKLVQLRRAIRATAARPGALARGFLLGVILQTSLVVLNWWLALEAGVTIPLYVWLFVWPLAKISALIPVTQGGVGVREAALALLFAPFGVAAHHAVATGLMFQAVVIAGGLVGGMVAYGVRGGASGAYSVGGNTR